MATTFSATSLRHCYKQGRKHFLSCICKVQYRPAASVSFPIPEPECFSFPKDTFNLIHSLSLWAAYLLSLLFPWPLHSPLLSSLCAPPLCHVSPGTVSSSVKNSTHAGFQTTTQSYYYTHSYRVTISLDGSCSNNIQRPKGWQEIEVSKEPDYIF